MDYLYEYFSEQHEILRIVTWNSWFFDLATLPIIPRLSIWETECHDLAARWIEWDETAYDIPVSLIMERNFCDLQKTLLLNSLHSFSANLSKNKMQLISNINGFNNHNGQMRYSWLLLCIKVRWTPGVLSALNFVIQFCGPDYICPMFEELYKWKAMRQIAIDTYMKNKKKMLDETQKKLERILHLN